MDQRIAFLVFAAALSFAGSTAFADCVNRPCYRIVADVRGCEKVNPRVIDSLHEPWKSAYRGAILSTHVLNATQVACDEGGTLLPEEPELDRIQVFYQTPASRPCNEIKKGSKVTATLHYACCDAGIGVPCLLGFKERVTNLRTVQEKGKHNKKRKRKDRTTKLN